MFLRDSKPIDMTFSSISSRHLINISKYYCLHNIIISSGVALLVAFEMAQSASLLISNVSYLIISNNFY